MKIADECARKNMTKMQLLTHAVTKAAASMDQIDQGASGAGQQASGSGGLGAPPGGLGAPPPGPPPGNDDEDDEDEDYEDVMDMMGA